MAHLQSRQRDERYNSPNAEHIYRRNSDGQILLGGPEVLRVPCRNQREGTGNHYCDDPVYYVTVEAVGLLRPVRSLAAIFLAVSLVANGQDVRSWGNLD